MSDRHKDTIEAARRSFNTELLSADYPTIHHDDDAVARLVDWLALEAGGHYLDLATGAGVMAFAAAAQEPAARIVGVDIADQAIARNRQAAQEQGRTNLDFHVMDGRTLDFPDGTFDGLTWRYALHHFPDLDASLADVRRVLKPGSPLVVADAVRHPADGPDFINRFQALKPDGHVRMYTPEALLALFSDRGFAAGDAFASAITFTRALDEAYRALLAETPPEVLDLYDVSVKGDEARLTFEVLNVRFASPAAP